VADTENVQDPVEAAKTIGLDTFLGMATGFAAGGLARRAGSGLSMIGRADTGIAAGRLNYTDPINAPAQAEEIKSLTNLAERGASETFLYPGGANRQALASLRSMFSDRYAFVEDWNSWRLANGIHLPSGDPQIGSRLLAGIPADVAYNVHRQLGGTLAAAGVTTENIPAYYEHLNRLLQADWAKDGHFFIKGVKDQPTADQALLDSRAAVDKQFGVWVDPKNPANKLPMSERWEQAVEEVTQTMWNPIIQGLAGVGKIKQSTAAEIIKNRKYYALVNDLDFADESIRNVVGGRGGLAATGAGPGFAHSTEGVGAATFQTDYNRMARLQTMIERQRVMNSLDELARARPNEFGQFFKDLGPAIEHRPIADAQLEGKGVQKNLYAQNYQVQPTPGAPGTPNEGIVDVYRRYQPDSQLFVRQGAESMTVPEGRSVMPVWKDGVAHIYSAPDWFADSVMGWNKYDTDALGGFLAKISGSNWFRKAVTMWSVPFIIGNVPRDLGDVAKNVGLGALQNYHQGLFESTMKATGILDFMERYAKNPVVETFPERVAVALRPAYESIAAGILGRDAAGNIAYSLPGFFGSKAGMATLTEKLIHEATPVEALNLPSGIVKSAATAPLPVAAAQFAGETVRGAMNPINWWKASTGVLETVAQATELAPRLGVYRWAIGANKTAEEAAYIARNSTVDFSKSGYVMAAMNKIFPLFNPRVQGEMRNAQAMWEDPNGWQTRAFITTGLPTMALWALQRHVLGDDINKLPQRLLDNNYIIPLGKWTDEKGDVHPVVIPIRKDPIASLISTPLEHWLNLRYNVQQGELPLSEAQRNRRSAAQMMVDDFQNLVPVSVNSDEVANPLAWGMGIMTMNPFANLTAGMLSGRDPFTQRPIDPQGDLADLPWQFHADQRTPKLYRALGNLLAKVNIPIPDQVGEKLLAPSRLDFVTRALGGTAAQTLIGWGGDMAIGALMDHGVIPPDALKPTTWEDLHMPSTVGQVRREQVMYALDQLNSQDNRPWYFKLPAILRLGGGGAAIQERIDRLDSTTKKQYEQTRDAMGQARARSDQINRDMQTFWDDPRNGRLTGQNMRDVVSNFHQQRQGAFDDAFSGANRDYAIKDPIARRDLASKIPGPPIDPWRDQITKLPEGVTAESLRDRVMASADPNASQYEQRMAKARTVRQIGDELHMPTEVIRDHLAALALGRDVPMLDVPNTWLEKVVNQYLNPPDTDSSTPPRDIAARRNQVVQESAQEGRTTPDALQQAINLRLAGQGEMNDLQRSYVNAVNVSGILHDPQRYPDRADPSGRPVGDPATWIADRGVLDYWKAKGTPRAAWPPQVRALDDSFRYAEANRIKGMLGQTDLRDYERWFGSGANMRQDVWEAYQRGDMPKYTTGTPREWLSRDMVIRLYNTLPQNDPEKNMLRPYYTQYRREITKGWREILNLDALERDGMFVAP
jgi:hypothetical protein